MGSDHLIALSKFLIWGVLGSAAFIVFLKAATGAINLRGLLNSTNGGSGISASRVQLLFLTLVSGFGYLGTVMQALADAEVHGKMQSLFSLPDVPPEILAALAGSSGFYLVVKGIVAGGWPGGLR